jgi:hypothetical protein
MRVRDIETNLENTLRPVFNPSELEETLEREVAMREREEALQFDESIEADFQADRKAQWIEYDQNAEALDSLILKEADRACTAFIMRLDGLPQEIVDHWFRRYFLLHNFYSSDNQEEHARGLLTAIKLVIAEMQRCDNVPPWTVSWDALVKRVRRKLARNATLLLKVPKASPWGAGEFLAVDRGLIATPIDDLGDYARALGVLLPYEFVLPVKGASA